MLLLAKADVEFPPFSDYFLPAYLLGASVRQSGTFRLLSFAANGGTFLVTGQAVLSREPSTQVGAYLAEVRCVRVGETGEASLNASGMSKHEKKCEPNCYMPYYSPDGIRGGSLSCYAIRLDQVCTGSPLA